MKVEPLAGARFDGETNKSILACNDYLRMGSGRSLEKLLNRYQTATKPPPTTRVKTLKDWSRGYNWQDRAATYDAEIERQKNEEAAEYRRQIMEEGFALDYERVKRLKELAILLGGEIVEEDKRWLPDVKQIGGGEFAERVDIVRFNAALIEQFRGVLDDLARETGGRKQRNEHTGKDGNEIIFRVVYGKDADDPFTQTT